MARIPLILVPGLLCDEAAWAEQKAALSDLADVSIVDHAGRDSITGMAEAILAAAPERFAVAGHSMGGRVALEIVRAAPGRVAALALLDTGYQARPGGVAGEEEERGRFALLAKARAEGMEAAGRAWIPKMVHPGRLDDARLMDAITAMIVRKTPEIFAAQLRALLNRPDAETLLPAIGCPTLLLCGRQDSWSPLSRHELMASRIPGSMLAVIEDSGHMSTMERPEAVSEAMRGWLVRLGA